MRNSFAQPRPVSHPTAPLRLPASFCSGSCSVIWDGPEVAAFQGAQRLLRLSVTEWTLRRGACGLRTDPAAPVGFSPFLERTGDWGSAAAAMAAAKTDGWREFVVRRQRQTLPCADDAPGFFHPPHSTRLSLPLAAFDRSGSVAHSQVAGVRQESATVRSLVIKPADGKAVTPHVPGQHLPIKLPGLGGGVERRCVSGARCTTQQQPFAS